MKAHGYHVRRNEPYAGGYTTHRYGQPNRQLHAFQIEINKKLYVNEKTYEPLPGLQVLKKDIISLVSALFVISSIE